MSKIVLRLTWTDYQRSIQNFYRNKNRDNVQHFLSWNRWLIESVDINEKLIFTCTDLHYIKKTRNF